MTRQHKQETTKSRQEQARPKLEKQKRQSIKADTWHRNQVIRKKKQEMPPRQ
ncbi:hypothetical protein [Capillibacterium thermochitinicola]|uniref:hypothetical protein n=1 Tax=Capillibacterium thermochitinicola TaxID=2699427 RepID=UPI001E407573|nr:hypothetical protein [Capillibacterium thermochitinicola]